MKEWLRVILFIVIVVVFMSLVTFLEADKLNLAPRKDSKIANNIGSELSPLISASELVSRVLNGNLKEDSSKLGWPSNSPEAPLFSAQLIKESSIQKLQ